MKRSLMRPTAALFPAVLLVVSQLGNPDLVLMLFFYYCLIQLCSLCSADSFCNAAAREPGVKRVDRRFSGTWPIILLGTMIASLPVALLFILGGGIAGWIGLFSSAVFIIIEQLFEERMYALSHPSDGVILSVVANVLLLAGMLIDSSAGIAAPVNFSGFYTACGAGLGMLISIIASYIIEPMHAFSMIPRNIGFFPKACVQTLLYPVLAYVILMVLANMEVLTLEDVIGSNFACGFAGLILWRLSRTVCRRAGDESRSLNLLLVAICALLIVGGCFMEALPAFGFFAGIAMLCSIIVYCAPSVRLYAGFILLCIAWLYCSDPYGDLRLIGIGCAVVAVILNLRKAFLRKV